LFGYAAAEAVGRHIGFLIPPDRITEEEHIIGQLREGRRVDHFDTVRLRKDGRPLHVSLTISPIGDQSGRIVGASKIVRDISGRIRTDSALKTRNQRLRLLSDAAGILLSTPDADFMLRSLFQEIGPSFGIDTYLNYMVDEVGGALRLASSSGVPDEALSAHQRLDFGQAISGEVALRREPVHATGIQDSDDARFQLARGLGFRTYICFPLLTGNTVLGTLSFASRSRDQFDDDERAFLATICDYASVAWERLRLLDELQDSDRCKDEFLATLAHELRNPLAPLGNVLEILKRSGGDPAMLAQACQTMERQLVLLVRLVDDLLDVSRITRNLVTLRTGPVRLQSIINDAMEMCRPLADIAGVTVELSLPAEPIIVMADAMRLTQMFSNLLNNACKYTPAGGRAWLQVVWQGTQVRISIRDNGSGIAPDEIEGIFDMFSRARDYVGSSREGLGIGLTLARRLTQLHGGPIEAYSEGPARGSEFVVTLPVNAGHEVRPFEAQLVDDRPGSDPSGAPHPDRR
jgi:PAS domain S-box-containing protein